MSFGEYDVYPLFYTSYFPFVLEASRSLLIPITIRLIDSFLHKTRILENIIASKPTISCPRVQNTHGTKFESGNGRPVCVDTPSAIPSQALQRGITDQSLFQNEKKRKARKERVRVETVKRDGILRHPLYGSLGIMREMGHLMMPSGAVAHERAEACAALLENHRLVDIGRRGNHYCRQFIRDPRTGIILTSIFIHLFFFPFSSMLYLNTIYWTDICWKISGLKPTSTDNFLYVDISPGQHSRLRLINVKQGPFVQFHQLDHGNTMSL